MGGDATIGGFLVEYQPMSPEEIERTVQSLLQQQARFAADLDRQAQRTNENTQAILGLTEIVGQLAGVVDRIGQAQLRTDAHVAGLTTQLSGLAEQAQGLSDQIQRTDSHLDILIEMFERHLREDHGKSPS